jgi:hypothetical protein
MLEDSDIETITKIIKIAIENHDDKIKEKNDLDFIGIIYPVIMLVGIFGVLAACLGFMYYGEIMFIAGCVTTFISLSGLITYENAVSTKLILKKIQQLK